MTQQIRIHKMLRALDAAAVQSLPLEGKVPPQGGERGGGRRFLRCGAFLSRNVATSQNVPRSSSSVRFADSFPSRGSLFCAQNVQRSNVGNTATRPHFFTIHFSFLLIQKGLPKWGVLFIILPYRVTCRKRWSIAATWARWARACGARRLPLTPFRMPFCTHHSTASCAHALT